jgi:hypothetical protein
MQREIHKGGSGDEGRKSYVTAPEQRLPACTVDAPIAEPVVYCFVWAIMN